MLACVSFPDHHRIKAWMKARFWQETKPDLSQHTTHTPTTNLRRGSPHGKNGCLLLVVYSFVLHRCSSAVRV
ncbi:hypothetical protein BHE74_00013579 [Ensete ventricosum]|nr:hypothetical protein BHE74_00013579 [Ensete ventricosum]